MSKRLDTGSMVPFSDKSLVFSTRTDTLVTVGSSKHLKPCSVKHKSGIPPQTMAPLMRLENPTWNWVEKNPPDEWPETVKRSVSTLNVGNSWHVEMTKRRENRTDTAWTCIL